MAVSLAGAEPGTAGTQPRASSLIVPQVSGGGYPLKPELPHERPPRFSGLKEKFSQLGRVFPRVRWYTRVDLHLRWCCATRHVESRPVDG